ncbi:AAA family ATPase [Paractinoplanes durhamensis]|uniref:AAA family ATPase n=1 Tax=Paractinoplanes durhamensis TaxID=113563 RepID=UPI001EF18893|nr:AAA family ATPase [Actinoplanes durhamensis]
MEAVNAALSLRRPLLVTGMPGSGKSTLIESVASELKLGAPLRWHITSRSTLTDSLYRYDVLGRIHAQQFAQLSGAPVEDSIADFLQLGPLGAALAPTERPRALLIDEIDKSDLDLPSDLLDVLERGEFRIPELTRHQDQRVSIRESDAAITHEIVDGRVRCTNFPFIVMTSNGERDFPAAFLRRCVRFRMPPINEEMLARIVEAHLDAATAARVSELISQFARDVGAGRSLATDQLLNAVFLLTGADPEDAAARERLTGLLLRDLSDA